MASFLHVWEGQRGEHPKMEDILRELSDELSPTGLPNEVQRQVDEATAEMETERTRYLATLTLYDELFAVLNQVKSRTHLASAPVRDNASKAARDREMLCFAGDFLAAVEAQQLITLPTAASDSEGALFGITPEVYDRSVLATFTERQEKMVQGLLPKVEAKLREKSDRIVSFAQPEEENFVCGMGSSLVQVLESQLGSQREEEEVLACVEEDVRIMEQHHVQMLERYLTELENHVKEARLSEQFNWDKCNVTFLIMRIQTLGLHLQELEAKLMRDTYTPEQVAALKKIRDRLIVQHTELQVAVNETSAQLAKFVQAGPEFRSIVDDYVAAKQEMQQVCADIQFMENSPTVA